PGAAGALEALAGDPRVVVLATAVEPLGVYGELLLPLNPLPVPDPVRGGTAAADPHELQEVASVALFVRRARAADPAFALTPENAGAVAEICTLLDGLPLAVELAARRLRLLPPHLLPVRLRDRTTVLSGGPANAPGRHRSLAALAEWSCRGLDAPARALLERLSVYEPGFGLSAAGLSAEPA
ncbi:LuxR family transcriptional regulator, partial [Streptomyces virginiae]